MTKIDKAVVLAAGRGTRMRELTAKIPKPMIEVHSKPVLQHILEGLRNAQRLMKIRNPKGGEVKVEDVIDSRLMRKLDESGFIDKMYANYGASLK